MGNTKFCRLCGAEFQSTQANDAICLACQSPNPADAEALKLGTVSKSPALKGRRILVIDDERDLVSLMKKRLEAAECFVITAYDGHEALEAAKINRPDLIILDILMPKMTGYDFLKNLKKEIPGGHRIPVILMTARKAMKDFFGPTDFQEFLIKPFEFSDLLAKVELLLNLAAQRGEEP